MSDQVPRQPVRRTPFDTWAQAILVAVTLGLAYQIFTDSRRLQKLEVSTEFEQKYFDERALSNKISLHSEMTQKVQLLTNQLKSAIDLQTEQLTNIEHKLAEIERRQNQNEDSRR